MNVCSVIYPNLLSKDTEKFEIKVCGPVIIIFSPYRSSVMDLRFISTDIIINYNLK